VRPRESSQARPLEDEFFRQLAGRPVADGEPPPRPGPQPPEPLGGATDPLGPHPLAGRELDGDAHRHGGARPQRPPRQPSPGAPRTWGRLAAAPSLGFVVAALLLVVLGADGEQAGPAGGGRGAPNGSPASDEARLRVGWGADGADRLRARWRRGAAAIVAGRLTTPGGRPVAGARVSVRAADAERPEDGNRTVGELRTDRRGRYRAAIALDRGAARKLLSFSYLAYGHDTVPAARAHLEVNAPSSLDAPVRRVRRGDRVELHGRSAPHAALRLLADPPGPGHWRRLTEVRAAADGRWVAAVRFPRDSLRGRYRLRARVAANRRLGYLAAESRPLEVEVR
jgi:hypothetical protein